ncbi:MAG TPA: DUF2550 domain-containing protein, partial [Jatrophihabitantaceae bacterium]|nr:DUF2550 domain-containing protein [Jatrophihabitantaceae bacterium]
IAVLVVDVCAAVLARQRYMLRLAGGQPVAFQVGGGRWVYGIVRYAGDEFRCYRAFGIGTRPTAVLHRANLHIVSSRAPLESERTALPSNSVVVECRNAERGAVLAFSESGFTGFVSWLEASAPRS